MLLLRRNCVGRSSSGPPKSNLWQGEASFVAFGLFCTAGRKNDRMSLDAGAAEDSVSSSSKSNLLFAEGDMVAMTMGLLLQMQQRLSVDNPS